MKTLLTICLKRNFIALGMLCFITFTASYAFAGNDPRSEWVYVDLSPDLQEHLLTLPPDERDEQLRDWILLSFLNTKNSSESEVFENLYDFNPMRYDFMETLANNSYGISRSISLKNDELVVFVHYGTARKEVEIARLADEYRLVHGEMPRIVTIVEYELNLEEKHQARFIITGTPDPQELFSSKYGYFERSITNRVDLETFLNKIDDVVFIKTLPNLVILGGRRFDEYRTRSVRLEDLAVLYFSDSRLKEEYIEKLGKRGLQLEYENYVKKNVDYNMLINPLSNRTRWETELLYRQQYPYQRFLKETISEYVSNVDLHIGFSLDPQLQKSKFANELEKSIKGDTLFLRKWFEKYVKKSIINSIIFQVKTLKDRRAEYLVKLTTPANQSATTRALSYRNTIGEKNLHSLINGFDQVMSDENDDFSALVNSLVAYYDLSPEALEDGVKLYFEGMVNAIAQNKDMLSEIYTAALKGEMRSYFRILNYLTGKESIDLRVASRSDEEWFTNFQKLWKLNQSPLNWQEGVDIKKYILNDVLEMLSLDGYQISLNKKSFDAEVAAVVKTFQNDYGLEPTGAVDNNTYKALLNLRTNEKKIELSFLGEFLRGLNQSNSYQKGRYDGYLHGTDVAMTLFYTDLVMKLWSFDFNNSFPDSILSGFKSKVDSPVSILYHDDINDKSATRSWLGVKESAYDFYDNNAVLYFAHTATKIYNASPNDLQPGVENEANVSSARFANWWNNHYGEVADYEQEYHRLNQIMKWSIVIRWLKEKSMFSFLQSVTDIERNQDFEQWHRNNKELTTKVSIPFLDRRRLDEATECLDILNSRPFLMFDNETLIYSMSGGVSLGSKSQLAKRQALVKNGELMQSGLLRKWIDFSELRPGVQPRSLTTHAGVKYQIDTKRNSVLISQKSGKTPRGRDVELPRIDLNRSITKDNRGISISEKAGRFSLGELSSSYSENRVQLSYTKGETIKAKDLLKNLQETFSFNREGKILSSKNVEKAFRLPDTDANLVKLKGSDNWVVIQQTKKHLASADLRTARAQDSFENATFVSEREAYKMISEYDWHKTTTNWAGQTVTEFTKSKPSNLARSIQIVKNDHAIEAIVADRSIYVKNDPVKLAKDLDVLSSFGKFSENFNTKLLGENIPHDSRAVILTYAEKGDVLGIANSKIEKAQIDYFKSLVPDGEGAIKGLLFSEHDYIKLVSNDIVQVPMKMTEQQSQVFNFVKSKLGQDQSWKNVLQGANEITGEDVRILGSIGDGNAQLRESYYAFKSIDNLPPDHAVVDIRTGAKQPQILALREKGQPVLIELKGELNNDPVKIGELIRDYYRGNKSMSYAEFLNATEPLAKLLKEAVKATNAKTILTKEMDGVNSAVISKIHKLDPSVRFLKDQPDVRLSIDNAKSQIYANFATSAFLSSVSLVDKQYEDIGAIYNEIIPRGMYLDSTLSTLRFQDILQDTSKTQIVLVIRATEDGMVFSNRVASFEDISGWLDLISHPKEMLYIVSNEAEKLQNFFAKSGKFKILIASTFRLGSSNSLKKALENVGKFYDAFAFDKVNLSRKDYDKLVMKYPELKTFLTDYVVELDKKVTIEIGKLPVEEKRNIDADAWKQLSQKVQIGKQGSKKQGDYFAPKIEDIVTQTQLEQIKWLKANPENSLEIIKAMPGLKVEVRPVKSEKIWA